MQPKNYFSPVMILFFLIVFSVPMFWMLNKPIDDQWSVIEKRDLNSFPTLQFQDYKIGVKRILHFQFGEAKRYLLRPFLQHTYQIGVEKAASDQFPFRQIFIRLAKSVDRGVITLAYAALPDIAIPADMFSGRYILPEKKMLINEVYRFVPSDKIIIDNRISNYQELMDTYPEINFYFFYLERLSNSQYHPVRQYYWNADLGQAFSYFENHKPADLTMGKMMISSFDDHERNFYLTDHHLNLNGVQEAYEIIYELLKTNYPNISAPLKPKNTVTFPDIEFRGSAARVSYSSVEGEKFSVSVYDLPPFTLLVNGENVPYNHSEDYLAGNYSNEPYLDHYAEYFGKQKPLLEYIFQNNTDRNLLVFGSSFKRPLQPIIASHYHHTYFIDLRSYKNFSLSSFLANHPVNDILVLGENRVGFQDAIWTIRP